MAIINGAEIAAGGGLVENRVRVGFIGDSITASLQSNAWNNGRQYNLSDAPASYAMMQSVGGWDMQVNAGIAGQRSDQIVARIAADIVAAGVNVCVIGSYVWNNIAQGRTPDQTVSDLALAVTTLRQAGILPVICSPTPDAITGSTSQRLATLDQMIAKVQGFCRANGVAMVDWYTPLVDPATGKLLSAYNLDNSVHPNSAGNKVLGAAVATVLDVICSRNMRQLIGFSGDSTDLLAGKGMFGSNSGGVGTGWSFSSVSGAITSIVTDGTVLGSMQRIACTATAGVCYMDATISSGWSPGDLIEISGIITNDGGTSVPRLRAVYSGSPNPNQYLLFEPPGAISRGYFRMTQVIPAGVTGFLLRLQKSAGTGVTDIGQLRVRNLTTLNVT